MARVRARSDEWQHYYERADRRRIEGDGDPYHRHVAREAARERVLLAGAAVVMMALLATFWAVLMR